MTPEELLRCHKAVAEMQRDGLLESPDRKPQTRDDEILSQLD